MRVVFAGTPEFSVPCLQALIGCGVNLVGVYCQPDRPAGRGKKLQASPVKQLALAHALPVFQPENLRQPNAIAELAGLSPDLMVVTAYGLLLPREVLEIPRLGCVNLHASLLPRWRGAAPIQRAIEAGDVTTGVTLMQMEAQLDAGPILAKSTIHIAEGETAGALHDRLSELAGELLKQNLDYIAEENLAPEAQEQQQVTYAAKLSKAESPLDWGRSAVDLERKIRALYPWPVATMRMEDVLLRVIRASIWPNLEKNPNLDVKLQVPGTVVSSDPEGIRVVTGQGCLNIEVLQKPGGKPLPVKQFINGMPICVGTVLE